VDDFQKQLTCSWVENEDGAVDGLGGEVSFVSLVDCDTVDVCVVDKPNDLVREELTVVLRIQIWLCGLRRVQLQTFPDSFSQDIDGWVGFHYLVHGLLDELLGAQKPIAVSRMQVVRQVDGQQAASR